MRFAHLSDSHLGYRQFGKYQREQDFYDTFLKTIDKIIELDVDFVIHSGDIFDSKNPSPNALIAFQKGLLKLNEAGIPIFAIAGNHDTALRKNVQSPIEIFEEVGLNIIKSTRPFVVGDILICGLQYIPSSQSKGLEAIIENLSAMAEDYSKSILVLHQGVDIYFPGEAHELSFQDLPQNFDYYAMGHLHDYVEVNCGRGKFVYPGSTELYQLTDNFRAYGKGFCLVDMSHNTPKVERINIEPARQRFDREIQYKNIYNELKEFRDEIKDLNQKPIVDIRVVGGEFETSEVYEILTEILGDYVLVLRPFYRPDSADDTQIIGEDEFLNPIAALRKRVDNKYENDDVTNLSVDLLDMLSINSTGDAQYISDSFYDQHYYKEEGDEE